MTALQHDDARIALLAEANRIPDSQVVQVALATFGDTTQRDSLRLWSAAVLVGQIDSRSALSSVYDLMFFADRERVLQFMDSGSYRGVERWSPILVHAVRGVADRISRTEGGGAAAKAARRLSIVLQE